MTDVQNCFASEHINAIVTTTTTAAAASTSPLQTPTKNVPNAASLETTSPFVLRAPPSASSKLILQNMEEVLNSVKKKHREKHKRKREQKRRAALLAEAEEGQKKADEGHVQMDRPQPLREKSAQHNRNGNSAIAKGKATRKSSPLKCSVKTDDCPSIMQHFGRTAKNETQAAEATPTAKAKAANVFELMMNARNRSLGTNAGGQELVQIPNEQASTPQAKRKQLLEEWNERKGGAKRKLADEARGEYIELEMEQRSKRLRKMLMQTPVKTTEAHTTSTTPTAAVKRGRGRPRTRRLSSVDTVPSQDAQTAEFLAKQTSPTKKRDNLLGYFAKVQSPNDTTDTDTPKRSTRRTNNSKADELPLPVAQVETAEATETPSGRPRRSCVGKARYDYDNEPSPTKPKPIDSVADNSIEIIDLDNSNSAATPKKLAPLFVRQMPKPSLDATALRARNEFLRSGVPDKLKQEQLRQKQFEQYYECSYELFPRIAHVQQLTAAEANSSGHALAALQLRVELEEAAEVTTKRKSKTNVHIGSITGCSARDFHGAERATRSSTWVAAALPQLQNKRDIVKLWKNEFDRFPTFKCYNQMREKYRYFSAIDSAQDTQQVGEFFVVTRRTRRSPEQLDADSAENVRPPETAPNGELLYTEKYKPLLFEQVLVNLMPVQQLREFLSSWNGSGNRNSQTPDDASFDFGNDSSSVSVNSNTMVLLGPCSSGKTNAVFALANDMNFNVLEINAGMQRSGKKLLQALQEATQSHQIRKAGKLQPSLSGLKAKRQQIEDNELSQSVRKSLILIEDADILFDNTDAGFTDAIYTLAASSKRPVIVVATNPNCAHLQRLMQQNTVHFQPANVVNISKYLAVLALMENCPTQLDELISLYLYNDKNLRKTIMELQFFIQSGGDRQQQHQRRLNAPKSPSKSPRLCSIDGLYIHQRLFEFYTCAQNVEHCIPFPVDFRLFRLNLRDLLRASTTTATTTAAAAGKSSAVGIGKRKSRSPKKAWLNSATHRSATGTPLNTLSSFYEHISLAALLDARLDRTDRLQPHLTEEIAHTLVELSVTSCLGVKQYAYNLFDKPQERATLGEQLGNVQMRSACARALDLEPALRAICRSEKQRAAEERRSSRFYHYLRNHATNMCSFATEPFDAACSVLQEAEAQEQQPTAAT